MKKSYIPKVSTKQAIENALRRKIKAEKMKVQLATEGYIFCQNCGQKPDFVGIQLSHKIALSQGGKTDKENCELFCDTCHKEKRHHQRVIKSKPMWSMGE